MNKKALRQQAVQATRKQQAQISGWTLFNTGLGYCLFGKISCHPNQRNFDSAYQQTSRLLAISFDEHWAETENTIYELL